MNEARTTICLQRLLPATPQDVFAAWTDPDSVKEWMGCVQTRRPSPRRSSTYE